MNLQIGKIYTFNTFAPSILGTTIKNAKLKAILDYESATKIEAVILKHRSIFPLLPSGTIDNPESYTYFHFLSESGDKIIIAEPWIVESTVEIIEHINLQVTLPGVSLSDTSRIRDALNAMGYSNYSIKQI